MLLIISKIIGVWDLNIIFFIRIKKKMYKTLTIIRGGVIVYPCRRFLVSKWFDFFFVYTTYCLDTIQLSVYIFRIVVSTLLLVGGRFLIIIYSYAEIAV